MSLEDEVFVNGPVWAADRIEHLEQQLEKAKDVLKLLIDDNLGIECINHEYLDNVIKKARDFLGEITCNTR